VKLFNGIVINDKFCWSRQVYLKLSHWHLSLRLQAELLTTSIHLSDKDINPCLGGEQIKDAKENPDQSSETMEGASPSSRTDRCATPLGQSLSVPP
jgi:hypothetical protein